MSDFHPDQWNPAWSVESILKGLVSFMIEGTSTAGSITTTAADKHKFAKSSGDYNLKDADFCEMFPEMVDRINAEGAERQKNSASADQVTLASAWLVAAILNAPRCRTCSCHSFAQCHCFHQCRVLIGFVCCAEFRRFTMFRVPRSTQPRRYHQAPTASSTPRGRTWF